MSDAAATTGADDFAFVVGLSRYPAFGEFVGPLECARDVAAWLTDPTGGSVPRNQVILLGDVNQTRVLNKSAIDAALQDLISRVSSRDRRARRLYMYLTGLAARTDDLSLALLMPQASPGAPGYAIGSVQYAGYFRESGLFEEVVLLVDVDVVPKSIGPTSPPPWQTASPTWQAAHFYAISAEGQFMTPASANAPVGAPSGAFTRALLEGLRGAAAGPEGAVTSITLTSFVRSRLKETPGRTQEPLFETGGTKAPMVLASVTQQSAENAVDSPAQKASGPETISAHQDDPALVDALSRRPFADVIAARIDQVHNERTSKSHGAFIINLHGPWGAGKTSVLNFLREYLQSDQRAPRHRWIVVEFNAWQHQRLQPPWWRLIHEIYLQALEQLGVLPAFEQRVRRLWWRVRMNLLPSAVAAGLVILAVLISTGAIPIRMISPLPGDPREANGVLKSVELGLKILSAAAAAVAVLYASLRSMAFGSSRAAQVYLEMRSDPLRPIVGLFQSLIRGINRPVIVFIDDLDRCDSTYVVELLEGIQTLFRSAPVTYLVAADRKWISSCFESKFTSFGQAMGEPGRPLGHLFLDKLFQLSIALPRVSPAAQHAFWNGLLRVGGSRDPRHVERDLKIAEREAIERVKDVYTQDALEFRIAEVAGDPLQEQAMRAAAALQITSAQAQRETEHWLQPFLPLLEPNPRSMKRLLNAYGVHQATQLLAPRGVPKEAMVRWTIVELRWPLLAEHLADRPQAVAALGKPVDAAARALMPAVLRSLCGNADVKAVLTGGPQAGFLDEGTIRKIVGAI